MNKLPKIKMGFKARRSLESTRQLIAEMATLIEQHPRKAYFSIPEAQRTLKNREPEIALRLLEEVNEEYMCEGVISEDQYRKFSDRIKKLLEQFI